MKGAAPLNAMSLIFQDFLNQSMYWLDFLHVAMNYQIKGSLLKVKFNLTIFKGSCHRNAQGPNQKIGIAREPMDENP